MIRRSSGGWRRRALAAGATVGAAVALVAACTGGPTHHAASSTRSAAPSSAAGSNAAGAVPADLRAYYQQRLQWKPCDDDPTFRCTTLTVPMDYAHPGSKDLYLALVELPAGDPVHRLGSLVVNPGGPGVSGVNWTLAAEDTIDPTLRDRYDIVGFDPRGVGQSDPVHCANGTDMDRYLATAPVPSTARQITAYVAATRAFDTGCTTISGPEVRYVGTRDAARDIDVLRAALGDRTLTYLGFSYGTYLGATYADEFPTHVGRMVLDGAIDPTQTLEQQNLAQAEGFEDNARAFLTDCVHHPHCPMGRTLGAATTALRALLTRLGPSPARTIDPARPLTQSLAYTGLTDALYTTARWPSLRAALAGAQGGHGDRLLALADDLTGRVGDAMYEGNLVDALNVIDCDDADQELSLTRIESDAKTFARHAPIFGAETAWGMLTCALWPYPSPDAPRPIAATGSGPVVVVGTTRDPATPYTAAVRLAHQLSAGHLLTRKGVGHTAYNQGNACIDAAIDTFLIAGVVPAKGQTC